jgi:hypothetical protein
VYVHNEDRLARISRLGESIQIGEVEAGVPTRERKVGTGIVMGHEEILLPLSLKKPFAVKLADDRRATSVEFPVHRFG